MSKLHSISPLYFPPPPWTSGANKAARPITPQSTLKNASSLSRRVFMITLLLLSFIIITLGFIYASCVALPHSDNTTRSPSGFTTTPPRDATGSYAVSGSDSSTSKLQYDSQKDQTQHDQFTSPAALASLGFYTLTLPTLTMLHTGTELVALIIRPQSLSFIKEASSKSRIARVLPTISTCVCALLLLGWMAISLVWTNCETVAFISDSICPVQVRGHNMLGIAEISMARIVFAWLVVLVYLGYAVYALVFAPETRRRNRLPRKVRFSRREKETADEPEEIVIHLGEEVAKDMR